MPDFRILVTCIFFKPEKIDCLQPGYKIRKNFWIRGITLVSRKKVIVVCWFVYFPGLFRPCRWVS